MKIDVSERIETAKRLTAEWADRAGYKKPLSDDVAISKKANDLRRILSVSAFGCQQRNVHALLEVLIGEKFPVPDQYIISDYAQREPFAIGSVLVPLRYSLRPGIVVRVSGSGNAGLRLSNGELMNSHVAQHDLRPATDEEIDTYFSEFFGITINPADMPSAIDGEETEETGEEIPF